VQLLRPAAGPGQFQIDLMNERRSEQQATSGQVKKHLSLVYFIEGGVLTCRTVKMRMTKRQLPLVVGHLMVARQSLVQCHLPHILPIH